MVTYYCWNLYYFEFDLPSQLILLVFAKRLIALQYGTWYFRFNFRVSYYEMPFEELGLVEVGLSTIWTVVEFSRNCGNIFRQELGRITERRKIFECW
jgi:hypothetical protein